MIVVNRFRTAAHWVLGAASLFAVMTPSLAQMAVTDRTAQAVARQILDEYRAERGRNVGRWSTLAADEGTGKVVDCPVSSTSNAAPVSFKDCNLEYFKLREERWKDVMAAWEVLTPNQRQQLTPQVNAIFDAMDNVTGTSLGSQSVKRAYQSGGGSLSGLLQALGLNADDDTNATVASLLEGSSLQSEPEVLTRLLQFNTSTDIQSIVSQIDVDAAAWRGHDNQGFDTSRLKNSIQLNKQDADTQKARIAAGTYIATNSRTRADAVKDITAKIQALGSSSADASLVSAKMAEYEFYLAALDALAREEQIKAVLYRQGEQAEERLKAVSMQAARAQRRIQKISN